VARPHLAKIGVKLTTLRPNQAEYIGAKADHGGYTLSFC
jgi:S-adenosylhomocysteine hydrolase